MNSKNPIIEEARRNGESLQAWIEEYDTNPDFRFYADNDFTQSQIEQVRYATEQV